VREIYDPVIHNSKKPFPHQEKAFLFMGRFFKWLIYTVVIPANHNWFLPSAG
jgi:hypothetical protein